MRPALLTALPLLAALVLGASAVRAQDAKPDPRIVAEIAPSGVLRAAINLGNPVLAPKDAAGHLGGVTVALAQALGRQLGVPVRLMPYNEAGAVFADAASGWDVAFLAIDPQRAQQIDFTTPYVVMVGTYLVRADSPFRTVADLDRDGVRIAAAKGSAYELYISRTLKHATVLRAEDGAAALDAFRTGKVDAMASIEAALNASAQGHSDWRVISPGFQTIRQSMALPKGRPPEAKAYVDRFLERMKASGFVRKALDDSGQEDAAVAPAESR
jgi:polar amino acid transport system substrate-binding protein